MDKTNVKSSGASEGDPNHLPLPASAYQRAPTLMASDDGGNVRVWSPDFAMVRRNIRQLYRFSLFNLAFGAAVLGLDYWVTGRFPAAVGLLAAIGSPFINYIQWAGVQRRPRYLSTDSNGIGITTAAGVKSFRWSQVSAANFGVTGRITLTVGIRKIADIIVIGFSESDCEALKALIIKRAGLTPDPKWRGRYSRKALREQRAITDGGSRL